MQLHLLNGAPAILDANGNPILTDITCGVRYRGNFHNTLEQLSKDNWTLTHFEDESVAKSDCASLHFRKEEEGFTLFTEFTNIKEDIKGVGDFIVLRGHLSHQIRKLLCNGLNNINGNRTNEMQTPVETLHLLPGQNFESGDFAACVTDDEKQFIVGFLTYLQFFGSVWIRQDGTLEVRQFPENHPLPNGKSLRSDIFYFTYCDNLITALPEYCEKAAQFMGGALHRFDVPAGYCTWYYYLFQLNETIIRNSVEDVVANKKKLPIKFVQIDDGWQNDENFPQGMKAMADHIRASGFTPGLWFAPFWSDKPEFREAHPELYAKSRATGERVNCLDYSIPEACDYLRERFRTATYDWGYEYLKLDAITSALGNYCYSDPDFNSVKNYRKALQIIQESIPENTFVLGCTAPFGTAIGLVDGMRVSKDIFENWDAVCNVFNSVLKRYYYHKHFFINDADCLIARKAENEDDECMRRCTRTDEEIRTYISVTAASGGIIMFSDKLRLMKEEQLQQLSYLFPMNTDAALPLDLMDSRIPGVLDCGKHGKNRVVILVNWDNVPKTMSIDAKNAHVFEFWTKQYKGLFSDVYEAQIPAHGCQVLVITDALEPTVIGTDSALIPRFEQSFENDVLTVRFNKEGETLYIHSETSLSSPAVSIGENLYTITQCGNDMTVSVRI